MNSISIVAFENLYALIDVLPFNGEREDIKTILKSDKRYILHLLKDMFDQVSESVQNLMCKENVEG